VKEMVQRIYNSSKTATKLIDQLLTFSRKRAADMNPIMINDIVEYTLDMLSRTIGEDIVLVIDLDPKIDNILADETQVEQIFMNLVINARHAMPSGGTLTVQTSNVTFDEEYAMAHHGVQPIDYVKLLVADTGVGMVPDVKDRIFEPFFTTKEKDKGTGLGLSTVFGIVEQHSGFIRVESEPGEGSRFEVYIPAVAEGTPANEPEDDYRVSRGDETLLIVEDDESVRRFFLDVLTPLGYNIYEAESGEKAIEISNKVEGKIDLLLTDVVMTGINGWELSEKIREMRPDIKDIFVSGFVENPIVIEKIQKHNKPFIKKPLGSRVLARTVRKVLDGTNSSKPG